MVKNYFNRFRKGKGKKMVKAKAKKVVRGGGMTFAQKVQKIIASNVENKITTSLATINHIGELKIQGGTNTKTYTSFAFSPHSIFDISQGTGMGQRIGNKIKLKRWIIKGLIQPNSTFNMTPAATPGVSSTQGIAPNTLQGYVDVYFGRYNNNISPVSGLLTNFYQNGAVDITPTGTSSEQLYSINKDIYKIYYHKRFKVGVGLSNNGTTLLDGSGGFAGANGFGMTKSFGFDVCKYICKNRVINYDEIITTPMDNDIENLTLWAIFHPAAGDVMGTTPGATTSTFNYTFFDMNVISYAEYEDA